MLRADGAAEIAGNGTRMPKLLTRICRGARRSEPSHLWRPLSGEEIVHTVPTEALAKLDLATLRVRGPGCGAYLLAELAELCVRRAARRCKIAAS